MFSQKITGEKAVSQKLGLLEYWANKFLTIKAKIMSCTGQPLPSMFVSKSIDEAFIGNFMKKKHPALSQLIGKPETSYLYFSSVNFKTLFNSIATVTGAIGLRIYFASYTHTGTAAIDNIVAAGYDGLLTLIFAPTGAADPATGNYTDIGGNYFLVSPLAGGGVITISPADAHTLVNSYVTNKLPLLQQIIGNAGVPAAVKESRTLWIAISAFTNSTTGFIKEMDCQGAAGITAYIGSHPKGSVFPDGNNKPIDWQLSLIFCLATQITSTVDGKTYTYHFDIDDTSDYAHRLTISQPVGSGDTLNPCPPATTNCSNV